ncbi:MAG: protein kinase [Planctomycetaceae bacterium]|nr:protein kinase [Planctomycetaceae bacterium]
MDKTNCPDGSVLRDYVQGQLPERERQSIESHLEICDSCEAKVARLEESIPFGLPLPPPDDPSAKDTYADLVTNLKSIRQTPSHSHGDHFPNSEEFAAEDSLLGTKFGAYRLISLIGRGGMGAVYKAEHISRKRPVAVKVLPPESLKDDLLVRRFCREIRAVSKLDHPHIVRAIEAGSADGVHFLVMELIDGPNLAELVARHHPLTIPNACEIAHQAAAALQAAHKVGLVHRDIKPTNLILESTGTVKLLDLGLALLHEDQDDSLSLRDQTGTSQIMGTADYMAPEQAIDTHNVDVRADIYSLGCTLFFLLTGKPPYYQERDRNPLRTLMRHANDPIPDIRRMRSDIPASLATLLSQMLAKQPDGRPATPVEICRRLDRFVGKSNLSRFIFETQRQDELSHVDSARPTRIANTAESTVPHRSDPSRSNAVGILQQRSFLVGSAVLFLALLVILAVLIKFW